MDLGEISSDFILPLLKATRDFNCDPENILKKFNIDEQQLSEPNNWISIPRFMRIGEALIDLTGNPTLGLTEGFQMPDWFASRGVSQGSSASGARLYPQRLSLIAGVF